MLFLSQSRIINTFGRAFESGIYRKLMKLCALLLVSSFTVLSLASCNTAPDLTEEEVYCIINEVVADDSLSISRVCWKFKQLRLTTEYKKEFTDKDAAFIARQQVLFKNLKVKPDKLKGFSKQTNTLRFITVDTVCTEGILHHIFFPLIGADRQKLIMEFQEDCNCMLGGHGGQVLYNKKNGHWVRSKVFNQWISYVRPINYRKK